MDATAAYQGSMSSKWLTELQILFVINNPEVYKSPNSNTYMSVYLARITIQANTS